MDKVIEIAGKTMTLRANALLPRKYRHTFNRDLIADMNKLSISFKKSGGTDFDAEVCENLTWLMLREGGEDVGNTPEDWLATLDDILIVYAALPDVVELWGRSLQQTAIPKKK